MTRKKIAVLVIILIAVAIALYVLISTGFFILLYLLLFGTSIGGHDPLFMQDKEPNQRNETDTPCDFGIVGGHHVSGTDKYGFGFVSCVQNGFTLDSCRASEMPNACEYMILIE